MNINIKFIILVTFWVLFVLLTGWLGWTEETHGWTVRLVLFSMIIFGAWRCS